MRGVGLKGWYQGSSSLFLEPSFGHEEKGVSVAEVNPRNGSGSGFRL